MLSHKLAYEQDANLATLESPNEQVDRKSALLSALAINKRIIKLIGWSGLLLMLSFEVI